MQICACCYSMAVIGGGYSIDYQRVTKITQVINP